MNKEKKDKTSESFGPTMNRRDVLKAGFWSLVAGICVNPTIKAINYVLENYEFDFPESEDTNKTQKEKKITIGTTTYTLKGTPEEQETLEKTLQESLRLLTELNIPFDELTHTKKIKIQSNPTIQIDGAVINPGFKVDPLDTLEKNTTPFSGKALPFDHIHLNLQKSGQNLPAVLAHEMLHILLGDLRNQLWNEGIAYALNLLIAEIRPNTYKNIDFYAFIDKLGLQNRAWNYCSVFDTICSDETNDPQLLWQNEFRRHIASLFWKKYLKKNPNFLTQLIKGIRKQIPMPQTSFPTEALLIDIAEKIDPSFREQYFNQPFTKTPKKEEIMIHAKVEGKTLYMMSGLWHHTTLFIKNSDKKTEVIKFLQSPYVNIRQSKGSKMKEDTFYLEQPNIEIRLDDDFEKVEVRNIYSDNPNEWITVYQK